MVRIELEPNDVESVIEVLIKFSYNLRSEVIRTRDKDFIPMMHRYQHELDELEAITDSLCLQLYWAKQDQKEKQI